MSAGEITARVMRHDPQAAIENMAFCDLCDSRVDTVHVTLESGLGTERSFEVCTTCRRKLISALKMFDA